MINSVYVPKHQREPENEYFNKVLKYICSVVVRELVALGDFF